MAEKRLNVLWISPGFAANELDSSCIPPLQDLARELSAQGTRLFILTLDYPFHAKPYTWHGIPIKSANKRNRRWGRLFYWFRIIKEARVIHHKQPIQAIHSFWLGPCWLIGKFLARQWSIPHFTTLMGQDVLPNNPYLKLSHYLNQNKLIALSQYQKQILEMHSPVTTEKIIPWGLPVHLPGLAQEKTIDILGCGSLIPVKNWTLWLEVVATLCGKYPHLKAELIGSGPEHSNLQKSIQSLGLEKQILLLGQQPREVVWQKMAAAKIYFHTALFESFGMTILEAADMGCRVVSTPVGVAPEIAHCAENPSTLAELVKAGLHGSPSEIKTINYSVTDTSNQYISLYTSANPSPVL